jgi:hypothetical protein
MTRLAFMIVGVALVACRSDAHGPRAKDCFGYIAPAGWKLQPSKTGADLVLGSPIEFPIGDKSMHDTFIVRFIPGDISLDSFKTRLLDGLSSKKMVNAVAANAAQANPAAPPIRVEDVPTPKVTPVVIGGHDGFRIDTRTTLAVGTTPVESVNATLFVKFGTEIVSVAASYMVSRETETKPLADAFLSSLNFDRCH